jgi:hypothetical protein
MKNQPQITTAFLSIYAGLIAIQHGIFEMIQGSRTPSGVIFNAIGSPCEPQAVWHACFPAMTLIPNLLVTGIAAVLVGLGMAVWGVAFFGRKRGRLVLGMLSVLALLVGGGFVPVFIGLIAVIASCSQESPPAQPRLASLAPVWLWTLVLMVLWLPGSWLLGHFFGLAMLSVGGLLFLVFDIGLPVLAVALSATHFQSKRKNDD